MTSSVKEDFDWAALLNFIASLFESPLKRADLEAQHRTVISRAYFAAFNLALIHLEREGYGPFPETGEAHKAVKGHYAMSQERTRALIAQNLVRLRQRRNEADYHHVLGGDSETLAKQSLREAQEVVKHLKVLDKQRR